MMTRREINLTLPVVLTALFAEGSASMLKAETALGQQGAQDHMRNMTSVAIQTLIREPLAKMAKPVVSMITLTLAPGSASPPHKHTGPVFAYLLEGEIENQVDPNPPQRYKPGEFFYEPPLHVHRMMRNLSATKPAKLLIVQVEEQGVPFTVSA